MRNYPQIRAVFAMVSFFRKYRKADSGGAGKGLATRAALQSESAA